MTTERKPLGSGFGTQTTGEEALGGRELRGKVALVTGGHSGIGLETTRVLSKARAVVVVGARDVKKARVNLEKIGKAEVIPLDLASPSSIDSFAAAFLKSNRPLDMGPMDKWVAYGQLKTATSLFAVAFDKRAQAYGVRAFAVHPEAVLTDLVCYMSDQMKN
jgi:NAD(P)-dependent dehydrogenase (short-subunit alcohol dehydrogenase family)